MKEKRILETIESLIDENNDFNIETYISLNGCRIHSYNEMLINLNKFQLELQEKYLGIYRFVILWCDDHQDFRLFVEEKKLFKYKILREKDFSVSSSSCSYKYFNDFDDAFRAIKSKSSVEKYKKAISREYR